MLTSSHMATQTQSYQIYHKSYVIYTYFILS